MSRLSLPPDCWGFSIPPGLPQDTPTLAFEAPWESGSGLEPAEAGQGAWRAWPGTLGGPCPQSPHDLLSTGAGTWLGREGHRSGEGSRRMGKGPAPPLPATPP